MYGTAKMGLEMMYYWVVPVGDARFAWTPIVVLAALCVLPALVKRELCALFGIANSPHWFYAVDLSLVAVTCTGCVVFGVTQVASDSFMARSWVAQAMVFVLAVSSWGYSLLVAVLATKFAGRLREGVRKALTIVHLVMAGMAILPFMFMSFGGIP